MICSCTVWAEWRTSFSPLLPLFYFLPVFVQAALRQSALSAKPVVFPLTSGEYYFLKSFLSSVENCASLLVHLLKIYYRLMPYNQIHAQILSLSIWGSADRCHGDIPTLIEISIIQKTIDAKSSSMRIRGLNEQNLLIKKEPDNWRIQVAKRIQPREALIAG